MLVEVDGVEVFNFDLGIDDFKVSEKLEVVVKLRNIEVFLEEEFFVSRM